VHRSGRDCVKLSANW